MNLCQNRARSNGMPTRKVQMLLWQAKVHSNSKGICDTYRRNIRTWTALSMA